MTQLVSMGTNDVSHTVAIRGSAGDNTAHMNTVIVRSLPDNIQQLIVTELNTGWVLWTYWYRLVY